MKIIFALTCADVGLSWFDFNLTVFARFEWGSQQGQFSVCQ
jgi:hypothetical protein